MSLTIDLINKFVKATKDDTRETKSESILYGTTVNQNGKLYVKLDGSEGRLTPVSTTTDTRDGERVMVLIKNHTATITGNITSPSARAIDVAEAGKGASNFMYHDPEVGVEVGDRTTGEWVGCRTQMTSDSFNILDEDGDTVASYGKNAIALGSNNDDSIINVCNRKLMFTCDGLTGAAQMLADMLRVKAKNWGFFDAVDGPNWAGVSVSTAPSAETMAQITASEGTQSSTVTVKPDKIELDGDVYIKSKTLLDYFHPVNSVYISYSHDYPGDLFGGVWERISPYFLYGTGETGTIGEEVTVSINKEGDTGQGIKVSIWRRVA